MKKKQKKVGLPSKTEKELKEIAVGICNGSIFTNRHIRESDGSMLSMVFMPLIFMEKEQLKILEDVGLIYEEISKALPRGINGCPMFMSMRYLNKIDAEKLNVYWKEYSEIEKKFLGNEVKNEDGKAV